MVTWIKQYSPHSPRDVVGQDSAVQQLVDFLKNHKKQRKKAMLLHGPSGVGKTSAVHAAGQELGLEVVEVNASDVRNAEAMQRVLGNALRQQSLMFSGKIILVDEIDGLSGTKDRGGIPELVKLMAKRSFPIVMTANDPWNSKFSTLRSNSVLVQFHTLNYLSVAKILGRIANAEEISVDDDLLKTLARRSSGDARAAINDLQSLAGKNGEITAEDVESLSDRNRVESIMNALMRIFKTTQAEIALSSLNDVQENMDTVMLWIDENLPKEYTKAEDLYRAYDALSLADVFKGRIRRWQHWRFLVYINALMTAGVALGKDEKYRQFVRYTPTTRILKLWRAKMKYQKRKAIAGKIGIHSHTSTRQAINSSLPYLKTIFKNDRQMAAAISDELGLDKEEVEWLRK
jgi:replication factor C large subunit